MNIGFALPHYDFSFPDGRLASVSDVVAYAQRAEALGFDSVWVSDHLFLSIERYGGPSGLAATPEALTLLAAVAQATTRIRFGTLVLCAAFRRPALLAAQARTLLDASGGRFECGLGAGWYEPEFEAAGIEFGSAGARIAEMASVAGVLRAHLGDDLTLWIGGKGGPKVARTIAEHADGWNVVWRMTPDDLRARLDRMRVAFVAAGRDPEELRVSVGLYTLVGTDDDDIAKRFEALRAWQPNIAGTASLEEFARGGLVGTPAQCADTIAEFAALGVEEIIVNPASLPFSIFQDEQLDLIATELLPKVR